MDNESIAATLAAHENRIKVTEHRLDDLEEFQKQQNKLIISVDRLATNMETMVKEQKEQGERLKKLEMEPLQRWSSAKKAVFNAFLGAVGAAVAAGCMWLVVQVALHM